MYVLATIAGQIAGRMFDPIGWVLNLAVYFAFRRKLSWWVSALSAAGIGAVILQLLVWAMTAGEGRSLQVEGFFWWFFTALIQCGIGELVARGVRSLRGKSA